MVMVLFTVAELIEARSLDRARNAIKSLIQLAPERATILQSDGTWHEIAARSVGIDARVRVKPGERIALDGKIVSGRSAINQAPITGESLPVEKAEGDTVFAGTINESGSFEYLVTAGAGDSTLARIIHAVEEAQGADPAICGPIRAGVHPGGLCHRAGCCHLAAGSLRRRLVYVGAQGARPARHSLSVCTGHFNTSHYRQWFGRSSASGYFGQRWRLSGRRPEAEMAGVRQNRHHYRRQASPDARITRYHAL